jgi:hypothetical protein
VHGEVEEPGKWEKGKEAKGLLLFGCTRKVQSEIKILNSHHPRSIWRAGLQWQQLLGGRVSHIL